MERQQIFDKVEEIWDTCQDRNIGSNEAELDFRETVTDWIQEQFKNLGLFSVSKRYFLFECVNADKQKLNKLIIADDKESAIADLETNYPYIERWYTIEELNVC